MSPHRIEEICGECPHKEMEGRKGKLGLSRGFFEKNYFAGGILPGIFSEDALFDKYINN